MFLTGIVLLLPFLELFQQLFVDGAFGQQLAGLFSQLFQHAYLQGFVRGQQASLDEASLARAEALVGLKGYVTNITAAVMPAAEVIASYHSLWQIEASFRMSKTDLRARPIFGSSQSRV